MSEKGRTVRTAPSQRQHALSIHKNALPGDKQDPSSDASSTTTQTRIDADRTAYLPDGSPMDGHPPDSGLNEKPEAGHEDWFSLAHGDLWRRWQGGQRLSKSDEEKISSDPLTWRDLMRPPIVRQWVYDGKLYKADESRKSSYMELYFDLSYIGTIHLLADGAVSPSPRAVNIGVFILTFFIAFGEWNKTRRLVNVHGSDDVGERLYLLFRIFMIIGYASCSTGIELEQVELPDGTLSGWVINPLLYPNIHWSARFILIAGLVHLVLYLQMGGVLTRFRWAIFYECARQFMFLVFILPLAFDSVTDGGTVLALVLVAILAEWQTGWIIGFLAHHRAKHGLGWSGYRLAHNVEHLMDRSEAFVVLTLGEHLLQASYEAYLSQVGFSNQYGRAAMIIMISFLLLWVYTDSDCSRLYVHALRSWWITAVAVQQLFYVIIGSLILASSAITDLIQNDASEGGFHWFYAGSISVYLLCVLLQGMMHQNYDKRGSSLMPRWLRLSARFVAAAFIACVSLIPGLDNLQFLGIIAGALVIEVSWEQIGKLGVVGDVVALRHDSESKHVGKPPKYRLEDLSEEEKGFADAGIEDELGAIHSVQLRASQVVAYTC